eukprot:1159066-Pelagomonas_calceolata.AAC.8
MEEAVDHSNFAGIPGMPTTTGCLLKVSRDGRCVLQDTGRQKDQLWRFQHSLVSRCGHAVQIDPGVARHPSALGPPHPHPAR